MDIRGRNKVNPNFNMSSMTDIVFLLLIFFMITSTLVTTSALDILLPKASGKTENKKSTAVSITKNLSFFIDNKKVSENQLERAFDALNQCASCEIMGGKLKCANIIDNRCLFDTNNVNFPSDKK